MHAGHCTVTRLRDTLLGAALLWVSAWHPSCSQRRLSPCQSHVPALYLGSKLLRAHWQGSGQHRTLWGPGPHQASQVSELTQQSSSLAAEGYPPPSCCNPHSCNIDFLGIGRKSFAVASCEYSADQRWCIVSKYWGRSILSEILHSTGFK